MKAHNRHEYNAHLALAMGVHPTMKDNRWYMDQSSHARRVWQARAPVVRLASARDYKGPLARSSVDWRAVASFAAIVFSLVIMPFIAGWLVAHIR